MIDRAGGSSIGDAEGNPGNEVRADPIPERHRPSIALRWAANGGYAILLVIMALLPSTSTALGFSVPDWLAHAVAYGVQAALVYWAASPSLGHGRSLAAGVAVAAGFGLVTEGLQFFQPVRAVELKDLAANTIGALIFCGVIAVAGRRGARRGN